MRCGASRRSMNPARPLAITSRAFLLAVQMSVRRVRSFADSQVQDRAEEPLNLRRPLYSCL